MAIRMKAQAKYSNTPTVVDGIRFASKAESRRFSELKLLLRVGQIRKLVVQPRFLLKAQRNGDVDGANVGEYVGDFSYEELDTRIWLGKAVWVQVVEDVKGGRSLALYRWKVKHLLIQYGITVREIRYR